MQALKRRFKRSAEDEADDPDADIQRGMWKNHKLLPPALPAKVRYWDPLLLICSLYFFVTLPLILGIETAAAVFLVPRTPGWLVAVWALCLAVLLGGLAGTSCRDPGVLRRQREAPPAEDGKEVWRWSDQAQTYRPPSAQYDADCGVVIEGFDHVCPWTGTAIGKRNMCAFKTFTSCLLVNIIVLSALAAFGVRAGLRSRYDPSSTESEGADDAAE